MLGETRRREEPEAMANILRVSASYEASFIAITSEGGLLPADFLHELPDPKTTIEGVTPVAYHLAEGERLNEQINRSVNPRPLIRANAGCSRCFRNSALVG